MRQRPVDVVHPLLIPVRMAAAAARGERPVKRADVRKSVRLGEPVRDVDPESVDPHVEPEAHRPVELGAHILRSPS